MESCSDAGDKLKISYYIISLRKRGKSLQKLCTRFFSIFKFFYVIFFLFFCDFFMLIFYFFVDFLIFLSIFLNFFSFLQKKFSDFWFFRFFSKKVYEILCVICVNYHSPERIRMVDLEL